MTTSSLVQPESCLIESPSAVPWGAAEVVYMDPPWEYHMWGRDIGMRSAASHYPVLTVAEMCKLPINRVMARNSALFMWATYPNLQEAMQLGHAWGLTYKTVAFTWVKTTVHGKKHVGMGKWTRANPEIVLLFVKGKPRRASARVRNLIEAPIGRHSAKPREVYDRIQQLMEGDDWREKPQELLYLEIFARNYHPGWYSMGLDLPEKGMGKDIRDVLVAPHTREFSEEKGT